MSVFITDTHSLVWYDGNKHAKLSQKAKQVFQQAENETAYIYVPSVVLWEIAVLEQTGKIKLTNGFLRWTENLLALKGFELVPLTPEIVARAINYNFNNDPFDKIIVATAAELSFPLITKDEAITNSNLIDICW